MERACSCITCIWTNALFRSVAWPSRIQNCPYNFNASCKEWFSHSFWMLHFPKHRTSSKSIGKPVLRADHLEPRCRHCLDLGQIKRKSYLQCSRWIENGFLIFVHHTSDCLGRLAASGRPPPPCKRWSNKLDKLSWNLKGQGMSSQKKTR